MGGVAVVVHRLVDRASVVGIGLVLALCGCMAGPVPPDPSPSTAETLEVASATPSAIAATPIDAPAEPPVATLAVEGGEAVIGQLGSYTWAGAGSDSPWLPGSPLIAAAGEPLGLSLAPAVPIAAWTASAVTAGSPDGVGAVRLGSDSTAVAFVTPPSGDWSVQVEIRFAGDLGSAAYYWHLTVR
jgi:hypothetical protein